jgi:hypothetical protein
MASKRILLVEGTDDEHVVKHIFGGHKLPKLDEIKELGGIDKLLESFPTRLKESDLTALGLIVDADTDLSARWQGIRNRLLNAGYLDVPEQPASDGVVVLPPSDRILPKVGVWLMPDNRTNGILEDFLKFLVPSGDVLLPYAEQTLTAIPESRFRPLDKPKALMHTWLAWQKEPGKPFGIAITARYLDDSVPQVELFVGWLKRLFFEG